MWNSWLPTVFLSLYGMLIWFWIFEIWELLEGLTLNVARVSNSPCKMRSRIQRRHPSLFPILPWRLWNPFIKMPSITTNMLIPVQMSLALKVISHTLLWKILRADFGGNSGRKKQKGKEVCSLGRLGSFLVNSTEVPALLKIILILNYYRKKGQLPVTAQADWPNENIIVQP